MIDSDENVYRARVGVGVGEGVQTRGKEGWNRVTAFERNIGQAGVYHLPKSSGNFGSNVNGKANLVCPTGKFSK